MIKLLITDDEPLVQIGLKSMIDWEAMGIEICGAASNGNAAYELIREHRPEIVITDIRMPCSSGLELGKRCMDEFGQLPVFIILTSYEDFQYAKEAMGFRAVDYLVKIDLSPESLTASVKKALEQVNLIKRQDPGFQSSDQSLLLLHERFYIKLLNNLFESREQFLIQAAEFGISMEAEAYAAATVRFLPNFSEGGGTDNMPMQSCHRTLQMFQELVSKYVRCHIMALDTRFFAAVVFLTEGQAADWKKYIRSSLEGACQMLHNYYNVTFCASIGGLVRDPLEIASSYSDSRQIREYLSGENKLLFCDEFPDTSSLRNVFSMSLFRDDISRAFQGLDGESLKSALDTITTLLNQNHVHFSQALDAAGAILHFSLILLLDGFDIVSHIFREEPDTYCSLYRLKTVPSIVAWLDKLGDGLLNAFEEKKKGRQNSLVTLCCQYIREHIHERIFLQDIADEFSVSPNYLSQLFRKYMDVGISEYIAGRKVAESKKLLKETNLKIYEISDSLGFESAFYFSKVFKKNTGMSPKVYRNRAAP